MKSNLLIDVTIAPYEYNYKHTERIANGRSNEILACAHGREKLFEPAKNFNQISLLHQPHLFSINRKICLLRDPQKDLIESTISFSTYADQQTPIPSIATELSAILHHLIRRKE